MGTIAPLLDRDTATQAIEFVYGNLLDVSRIQLIYPIIVSYVFWGFLEPWKILLWCFTSSMVYVARILLTLQYRKRPENESNPWKWGRLFTATSIASGLLWGYSAFLFYSPEAQTGLVLLYVLIVGTAAGAVMISSYWMPGYLFYAVPSVALTAASLFINGDRNENILGFMLCLLLLMLISVAFKSREQGYAGIRLRFENLDLIEKLNIQKERAVDANRAKTRFLASANHDLRQPVHALSLLSYSLQSELSTDRGKEIYSQLDQTVLNLNTLLESLLDLSQLEAGALKVQESPVSLLQIGEQLKSEFMSLCGQKGLEFRLRELDEIVCTDPTLITRLLRNLLTNAVRYTEDGGILLAFRRYADGDLVSIEIWDTGIGIDPSDRQNVFREFFQVNEHSRNNREGLGLGLSICRKLAALLDLDLSLDSIPGRGTVFRVRIPLQQQSDLPVQPQTLVQVDKKAAADLDGKRVLVVDDDLIGLSALSQVLSSFGLETLLAQSTERALELLDEHGCPDLIVSDYRLAQAACESKSLDDFEYTSEKATGIDLINTIRRRPGCRKVPSLMVTGDTAPDILHLIEASGIPYLNKPVRTRELMMLLGDLLPARVKSHE